jgi:hypothetical protein
LRHAGAASLPLPLLSAARTLSAQMAPAGALFRNLLPMINLEETYGVGFSKAVLVRRGIFKTAKRRTVAGREALDSVDQ